MATIRSSLDPTPAQGLAYDISSLSPQRFQAFKSGNAAVGTNVVRFVNTTGKTLVLKRVEVSAGTAPTGADLTIDANVNGTTAFSAQSTRPKIVAGQKSGSAVPAQAGKPVKWLPGQELTIDVDVVGSTVAGADLNYTVEAAETRSDAEDITVSDDQLV